MTPSDEGTTAATGMCNAVNEKCGKGRCIVDADVVRIDRPADEHVRVVVRAPGFPASEPGQFVQVLCRSPDEPQAATHAWDDRGYPAFSSADWTERGAYLRRPFSIADHWVDADGTPHVEILSRAIGPGTRFLDALTPGDRLNINGPLGRPFQIPRDERPLILVGGGVGIPPLLYLARRLHERGARDVTVIFGARSGAFFPVRRRNDEAPAGAGAGSGDRAGAIGADCAGGAPLLLPGGAAFPSVVMTDDGSLGGRGLVTDALRDWAARRRESAGSETCSNPPPMVFACGPARMLHAVGELTRGLGMDCQLCIERTMGCGSGTCLSCVARVADSARPTGWRWALACSEGPVFDRDALLDGH